MTGNRIRELRKARGISQQELADYLGVHHSTLDRWEKNQTRPWRDDKLKRTADYLHVSVPYLLGYDSNEVA
jgi:transcriptional regulator with XRE-family HTH domain